MALLFKVFLRLFWVVVLGFQVAQSGDSETVEQAGGKETLVICETHHFDIHCPSGTIIIKDAYYGRTDTHTCPRGDRSNNNCKAANSLYMVRNWCENKNKCHLEASNNWFGDPCVGILKYLSVEYQCVQSVVSDHHTFKEILCETQSKKITCPEGRIIKFENASYGRMDKNTCPSQHILTTNCNAENPLSIVNERCENKKECHLEATNDWFGDPCEGTKKYLSVEYQCVQVSDHHTFKEILCETQSKKITCPEGRTIKFKNAYYGRMDKNTCTSQHILTTNCNAENPLSIVNERCGNKKECHLEATNDWFGDPCEGTKKYLSVEYQCVQDVSTRLNENYNQIIHPWRRSL